MNVPLSRLIAGRAPLLLDFDGPLCAIFAGYPAPLIAAELVDLLQVVGVALPEIVLRESDPLEVLRWTGARAPQFLSAVEDTLLAAELSAIATAEPTPYGREVIRASRQAGLPVAVVSNNSAASIRAFLRMHRLADEIQVVVGRPYARPEMMKPSPEPIWDAMLQLGTGSSRAVLVGDSLFDLEGARAAGIAFIGYANKLGKSEMFSHGNADAIISSMNELAYVLSGLSETGRRT